MSLQAIKETIQAFADPVVVTDDENNIVLVNRASKELFQYSKKELAGRPCSVIFSCKESGKAKGVRKDGAYLVLEATKTVCELTGARLQIYSLSQTPLVQSPAVKWLKNSIYIFTLIDVSDFTIKKISSRVQSILSYAPHELEARPYFSILVAEDVTRIREYFNSTIRNYPSRTQSLVRLRLLRKTGEAVVMEITARCFKEQGKLHLFTVGRDITEIALNEKKLIEIEKAKEAAENEGVLKIASMVLHEIRNPLFSTIATLQELVQAPTAGEEIVEALQVSEETNMTLNSLLLILQMQAGRFQEVHTPFSIRQLLQHLLPSFEKSMPCVVTIDEKLPLLALGDARKIQHVLEILFHHAQIFLQENTPLVLTIAPRSEYSEECFIQIKAQFGSQITSERIALYEQLNAHQEPLLILSQPQASSTEIIQSQHLVAAKMLVKRLGGVLYFHSNTKTNELLYQMVLPLPAAKDPLTIEPMHQEIDYSGCLKPYNLRVLAVDDNATIGKVLQRYWKKLGAADCDVASSGQEALERVSQNNYDIITVDFQMPGMSGDELVHEIRMREKETNRHALIILCSGLELVDQKEICKQVGADDFLVKPVSLVQLGDSVIRLIRVQKEQKLGV